MDRRVIALLVQRADDPCVFMGAADGAPKRGGKTLIGVVLYVLGERPGGTALAQVVGEGWLTGRPAGAPPAAELDVLGGLGNAARARRALVRPDLVMEVGVELAIPWDAGGTLAARIASAWTSRRAGAAVRRGQGVMLGAAPP